MHQAPAAYTHERGTYTAHTSTFHHILTQHTFTGHSKLDTSFMRDTGHMDHLPRLRLLERKKFWFQTEVDHVNSDFWLEALRNFEAFK